MTCMMNVYLVTIPGPTEHACLVALSCMPGYLYAVSHCLIHSVLRGGVCTVCVFAGLLLSAQNYALQLCYAELSRARFCTIHADKSDWQIRESVMVHTPLWVAKREREMQLGAAKLWERGQPHLWFRSSCVQSSSAQLPRRNLRLGPYLSNGIASTR